MATGSPIVLASGELTVATALTLTSEGPNNAVIDAGGRSRVFLSLANLTLTGITLQNGSGRYDPLVAWSGYGGAVSVQGGRTTLQGSTLVTSSLAEYGGGIHVQNPGSLTMTGGAAVTGNTAQNTRNGLTGNGGGILTNGGSVSISGSSRLSGNFAWGSGGGLHFTNGGSVTIGPNVTITGNRVEFGGGGGIYRFGNLGGTITGASATNIFSNTPNNCQSNPPSLGVAGCVG